MTRVTLKEDGGRYEVICEGHATGSREVCAAVSTLVFTLLGYLKNADGITVDREEIADGYADVEFGGGYNARAAFDLVSIGFLQLAVERGNFIEVII